MVCVLGSSCGLPSSASPFPLSGFPEVVYTGWKGEGNPEWVESCRVPVNGRESWEMRGWGEGLLFESLSAAVLLGEGPFQ